MDATTPRRERQCQFTKRFYTKERGGAQKVGSKKKKKEKKQKGELLKFILFFSITDRLISLSNCAKYI